MIYIGPCLVFGLKYGSGFSKDPLAGKNVISGFGNYAEAIIKNFASLRKSLYRKISR